MDIQKTNSNKSFSKQENKKEQVEAKTQWNLVYRQFKKHKLAVTGVFILLFMYVVGVFSPGFFAPNNKFRDISEENSQFLPPQKIHFFDKEGNFHLRPFIYNWTQEWDSENWQHINKYDKSKRYHVYFFIQGDDYKFLGLFETNIKFFGVEEPGIIIPFGTDDLGRCLFSRIIYASRISLSIGFIGVVVSFVLGLIFGGISGLMGGWVDEIIQRSIELLMSIPRIPLWMALAASIPEDWSAIKVYFAITVLLSLIGWTGLARVVRSKFMSLSKEDYVTAAHGYNTSQARIISKHLIPNFITYVIVRITLAVPGMILAETSLSFLGIGLRPPVVSWGVLLQKAQSFQIVSIYPWIMLPGLFVIIAVLAFNFVGDGLRDAADPYQ